MQSVAWALVLGLGLGLRHAFDADHLAVITSLVRREASLSRAALAAIWWALGHSVTFLSLALALLMSGAHPSPRAETFLELVVAAMLLVLGLQGWRRHRGDHPRPRRSALRPVIVGAIHGLAGSAGIALVAMTTLGSRPLAATYLLCFCVGTSLGMALCTMLVAWPLVRLLPGKDGAGSVIARGAALLSIGAGVAVAWGALR